MLTIHRRRAFHTGRIVGRDRHYRYLNRNVVARGTSGSRCRRRTQSQNNLKQLALSVHNAPRLP